MLDQLKAICDETHQICDANGSCTIGQVSNLILSRTKLDVATFTKFEAPRENPIWGEFHKWHRLVPYSSAQTIVDVRYANHLSIPERRFVVAKELCHALETNNGTHTKSDQAITDLVAELAVFSTAKPDGVTLPVAAEKLAEVGAIELYMPVSLRKQLIANGELASAGIDGMAARFELPVEYVTMAFDDNYIAVVETIVT